MKTNGFVRYFGVAAALILASSPVARAGASHSLDVGARYYQEKSNFAELPFDDGDVAAIIAYEYSENNVFWQLGCDLLPDARNRGDIDYAVTPQLNLMLKDWYLQCGVGALTTYTHGDAGENWVDLYWQFILGVSIPVKGKWSVQANAYYVFDKWDHLSQFDAGELDFGAYVGYRF